MRVPETLLSWKHNRNLQLQLENIESELETLQDFKEELEGRYEIKCPECKKFFKISNATCFVTLFYVPPYGCTGGAYWDEHERSLDIKCPKCEHKFRAPYSEGEDFYKIRYKFKEIVREEK